MSGQVILGKITFDDLSEQRTAADRSFRNKVINGDMAVNQEYGSTAVTPTTNKYISDQFFANISASSKLTFQQVADAPDGFKYSTKITVASQYSPAAGDTFIFSQPIEGQNIIDMCFGKASAKTVSISLQVKGSVPGKYSVSISNGTRSYVGTVDVTSGWSEQFITLTADNTGTWSTDNSLGVYIRFDLGSGSNFNATPGVWNASVKTRTSDSVTFVDQPNGSTLNITGVQFEIGAPSEFEMVPPDEQLRRCQKHYEVGGLKVLSSTATVVNGTIFFKEKKRTIPLMSYGASPQGAGTSLPTAAQWTGTSEVFLYAPAASINCSWVADARL